MGTTREEIRGWLESGKSEGATHMIVVCDTFDWEDYPVYVKPGEDPEKVLAQYRDPKTGGNVNMQKVMEVYSYSMDLEKQLKESRAWYL